MRVLRLLVRLFARPSRTQFPRSIDERLEPLIVRTRIASDLKVVVLHAPAPLPVQTVTRGRCWVIDGDTIVIDNVRLRLAGVDASELDHPRGQRAKWAMVQLCKGQIVTARIKPEGGVHASL